MGGGGGGSGIRRSFPEALVRCTGKSGGGSGGNKDNFGSRAASFSFFADFVFDLGSGTGSGKGGGSVVVVEDTATGVEGIGGGLTTIEAELVVSSF